MKHIYPILNILILYFVMISGSGYAQVYIQGQVSIFFPISQNITVTLVDNNGDDIDYTRTNEYGNFEFYDVYQGYYSIRFSSDYINIGVTEQFYIPNTSTHIGTYLLTPTTASLISMLYMQATTNPQGFLNVVIENQDNISNNTNIFNCLTNISNAIRGNSNNFPSANETRESVHDIGNRAGVPPAISDKVANDMVGSQAQMTTMGICLGEMSTSIQEILRGNNNFYYNTYLYQISMMAQRQQQQIQVILQMFGMDLETLNSYTYYIGYFVMHDMIRFSCN